MKVPQYQRQVGNDALRVPGNTDRANATAFGAGVSQGVFDISNMMLKEHQRAAVADAQSAMLQISEYANDRYSNPDDGVITKQQRNALNVADSYTGELDQKFQELAGGLGNSSARYLFEQQYREFRIQKSKQAMQYETSQIRAYENNVAEGTLNNLATNLANSYTDNNATTYYANGIKQQIALMGAANGWSPEYMKSLEHKHIYNAAYKNVENLVSSDYVLASSVFGEPSGVSKAGGTPKGERNNNPGNIVTSKNKWVGQTGSDGDFVVFATPEHGIRALGKNLINYGNQGFDTVSSIIPRWSPDGNEQSYVDFVSKAIKVSPDDKLDLNNPATLTSLTKAIIQFENGKNGYTDNQISQGIMAALGVAVLSSPQGSTNRVTDSVAFNTLEPSDQVKFLKILESRESVSRAQFKSDLELTIKDANAAYLRGKDFPNPPNKSDFIRAYGYHDGLTNYKNFEDMKSLGTDIAIVQDMPASDMKALIENKEPEVKQGYAGDVQRYETLIKAIESVNKERQTDPIAFAGQRGLVSDLNINPNDVPATLKSISERSAKAMDISRTYGTPLTVFSRAEADFLGKVLSQAPVGQQVELLDTLHTGSVNSDTYFAMLDQLGQKSQSVAMAGWLINKPTAIQVENNWIADDVYINPRDAAQTILNGRVARKGQGDIKGIPMPKESELRSQFNDAISDAFAGEPLGAESAYQIALDFYAGEVSAKGNFSGEIDNDIFDRAIKVATGGVSTFNGKAIRLPWGMDESTFLNRADNFWKKNVIDQKVTDMPLSAYQLDNAFGDSYRVLNGTRFLEYPDGRPIIITISNEDQTRDIPE